MSLLRKRSGTDIVGKKLVDNELAMGAKVAGSDCSYRGKLAERAGVGLVSGT